jgi:hypothetical protein
MIGSRLVAGGDFSNLVPLLDLNKLFLAVSACLGRGGTDGAYTLSVSTKLLRKTHVSCVSQVLAKSSCNSTIIIVYDQNAAINTVLPFASLLSMDGLVQVVSLWSLNTSAVQVLVFF